MGSHRLQFRLRSLMAVVAAVAVLMSVPAVALEFFALYLTVVAALIFVPTSFAPRKHESRPPTGVWRCTLWRFSPGYRLCVCLGIDLVVRTLRTRA